MTVPPKPERSKLSVTAVLEDAKAGRFVARKERVPEELRPLNPITADKVVNWLELGGVWILVYGGAVPLFAILALLLFRRDIDFHQVVMLILLGVFTFSVMETFAIFLLVGLKRLELPKSLLHCLEAASIGQTAGLLAIACKWLFL